MGRSIPSAIARLLASTPPDGWSQMTRKELIAFSHDAGVASPPLFADACLALGIGDGEPDRTVCFHIDYLDEP